MKRRVVSNIAACASLVWAFSVWLNAQTLPTKKDAEAILQNASEGADLWASDSAPFHLLASVHYELGGQPSDGTYDLLWQSPDQYREYFEMRTAKELEIASGGRLSILRNTPTLTVPLWSTRRNLRFIKNYFLRQKVKKVRAVQVNGLEATCIDSESRFAERQNCFDPTTNQAISVSFVEKVPYGRNSAWGKTELTSFTSLGKKRYPLRIMIRELDEKLDVTITTFEQPESIYEDLFVSPADAQTFDWCPNPITSGHIEFPSGAVGQMDAPGGNFPYYVLVGHDGHVKKSAPMRSAGPQVDHKMATWLQMAKFPIKSCRGNPVEYETVMVAPLEIRFR
jgi:hypothetical protein